MNIKTIIRIFAVSFLLVILLTNCDNKNYFFKSEKAFDKATWSQIDTLDFKVTIEDTMALYNLGLDIEHDKAYLTQNIYLKIHTKFPDGNRYSQQVNIDFADKAGKWYGDCSGNICSVEVDIQKGAFFNQIGDYVFTVEQFTRNENLADIHSLQFHIEDTKIKRVLK